LRADRLAAQIEIGRRLVFYNTGNQSRIWCNEWWLRASRLAALLQAKRVDGLRDSKRKLLLKAEPRFDKSAF